jgi:chemotaxis protein MotB
MAGRGKKGRGGHGGGEHGNDERWLLTYADMMTLLVAFFIMMYAMSIMNVQKFQQLAISVRSGFGGSPMTGAASIIQSGNGKSGAPSIITNSWHDNHQTVTPDPDINAMQHDMRVRADAHRLDKAQQIMQAYIKDHKLENVMQVKRDERGLIVTVMTDKMLFSRGDADLRPAEMGLLAKVAQVLNTVPNQVKVEGHTDNLPIHTPRFPSNWELSTDRATTVLRYFESQHVASNRLEASGYADQHPIVPNDTEQHRGINRRVEVVILKQFS